MIKQRKRTTVDRDQSQIALSVVEKAIGGKLVDNQVKTVASRKVVLRRASGKAVKKAGPSGQ